MAMVKYIKSTVKLLTRSKHSDIDGHCSYDGPAVRTVADVLGPVVSRGGTVVCTCRKDASTFSLPGR